MVFFAGGATRGDGSDQAVDGAFIEAGGRGQGGRAHESKEDGDLNPQERKNPSEKRIERSI